MLLKKTAIPFFFILSLFTSCKTERITPQIPSISSEKLKNIEDVGEIVQNWHHKDILEDSIPGIINWLKKAYEEKNRPILSGFYEYYKLFSSKFPN